MRCIVVRDPGPDSRLEIETRPDPVPGPGQLLVAVHASGINRADLLQRRGLYPPPPGQPDIMGLEFAGELLEAGPGVDGRVVGERVMGLLSAGGYADRVVLPASHALPVPEGLDLGAAAAIPEAFLTAFDGLEQLGLASGEWLLVHAVGSGVGTAALQLAHLRGARVVGTSRSATKLRQAASLGLDAGVLAHDDGWVPRLLEQCPGGVHAVLDLVGGDRLDDSLACLRDRGRLLLVGLVAGRRAELDLGRLLSRRLSLRGTVLRSRDDGEKARLVAAFADHALAAFARGELEPVVHEQVPAAQVEEAHAAMSANENFGKIVLRWSGLGG